MDLLGFVVLAALIWFAWANRGPSRKASLDESEQAIAKQIESHLELLPNVIQHFSEAHLSILKIKRRQLIYKDDYGKSIESAWRKEMEYFLDAHVTFPYDTFGNNDSEREYRLLLLDTLVAESCVANEVQYDPLCSGVEFEHLVETILSGAGAIVRRTPTTGDQGVDLLADIGRRKIAAQCKRSVSPIGNKAVQEAYAGSKFYSADEAWVISDAPFTKSARQLAASLGVTLLDFRMIEDKLSS